MNQIFRRKVILIMLILGLIISASPAQAATDNNIDRVPRVQVDHEFTGATSPALTIEEARTGEFRESPQRIRLRLQNAEWIQLDEIEADISVGGGADAVDDITLIGDDIIQLTLSPAEGADEPGWWRIPLYSRTTGGGYAMVVIESRGSAVSPGNYPYAEVLGDRTGEIEVELDLPGNRALSVELDDTIDAGDEVWLEFTESQANTITSSDHIFRMDLTNGQWFPDNRSNLNAAAMRDDAEVLEDTEVEITRLRRISDTRMEMTVRSDGFSSEPALIRLPLYFEVTEYGEVTLEVSLKDSRDPSAEFTLAVSEAPEPEEPEISEVAFSVGQLGYSVNDDRVASDVAPYIQPTADGLGRIMVPVRFVSDAVGADSVVWDPMNRKVNVTKGDIEIEMMIGNNILLVNGSPRVMDAVAEIQDIGGGLGRTMLPVAHLARALDVEYQWDGNTQTVTFYVEQ